MISSGSTIILAVFALQDKWNPARVSFGVALNRLRRPFAGDPISTLVGADPPTDPEQIGRSDALRVPPAAKNPTQK